MLDQPFVECLTRAGVFSSPESWQTRLKAVTPRDVEQILQEEPGHYRPDRLLTLLAPAAENLLETMAQQARQLTRQRFGNIMSLYAPLYVSNYCNNECTYCGFSASNPIKRRRLSVDEVLVEAEAIRSQGIRHLLLVSGEDRTRVTVDYLCELANRLRPAFSAISIEIQQLTREEYQQLYRAGIDGVTFYQETYDPQAYSAYHLCGPKLDYERRLRGPDDIAAADMRRLGLGVLLGLTAHWRLEVLALGLHAHHLMRCHWQTQVSFSFPRLRPARNVEYGVNSALLTDRQFVQAILALRLCFADAELNLSTREAPALRNALIHLGFTQMSAGSKTNPGGYATDRDSLEQFEISDDRSPAQIAAMLKDQGLEPVWKNWDAGFTLPSRVRCPLA